MGRLQGKKVVLGVSGGIAAYKALFLVRELRRHGAEVHVIMTEHATKLVTPLSFRELSGQPVTTTMWGEITHWNVEHIALANLADVFVLAPATANLIGKVANGIADDMLTTTVMATPAPVVVVPAMNTRMYENPFTQSNLQKLASAGYTVIEPESGDMACGTNGKGRFPAVETIVATIERVASQGLLRGKKVVVSAGGTREAIDPVRYLSNRSSGKMGYAVAAAAAWQGADVVLVSATTSLPEVPGVRTVHVNSAREMKDAINAEFDTADIVVKAAAVADYRPAKTASQKIKKQDDDMQIKLVRNPDILYELGQRKKQQILIGFAAETQNVLKYAKGKLVKKNLDMLVANNVASPGAGFQTETNIVTFVYRDGSHESLDIMTKDRVAEEIIKRAAELTNACKK